MSRETPNFIDVTEKHVNTIVKFERKYLCFIGLNRRPNLYYLRVCTKFQYVVLDFAWTI